MRNNFRQIFQSRMESIRNRRSKGLKTFGYICTYTPEELVYAAGVLPVRVFGKPGETPAADAYLYSNICSFVRSCFEEAFRDGYSQLDGLVACNSCDHIRRLYDVWEQYMSTPFTHIISLPCKSTPSTLVFFQQEIKRLKEKLEKYLGQEISAPATREAINVYNKTRGLLKRLYQLRCPHPPLISGAETLEIVLASMVIPKEEFNLILENYLDEIEAEPSPLAQDSVRLLVMGSELDDPEYLRLIEEQGAVIVTDDLCNGTRYFWDSVDTSLDPLEGLARRYLTRTPCPRMHPAQYRIEHLIRLINLFKVEGIIYETIKFCDLHSSIYPVIKKGLEPLGLPILKLEREYSMASLGQMKTRVQAFLESIKS